MSGVVIVGGGHAGVQLAASLRDQGFEDDIVLLEQGAHLPYQRPPLSKQYLSREQDEPELALRPESFFTSRGIRLRLGVTVTSIDRIARVVHLRDGESVGYRHLVLALGAVSRTLDIPGSNMDGVLALRTLEDAQRLRRRLEAANDVVIVGGGFIGLEVAAIASAKARVTIVEPLARVMARSVTPLVSKVVESSHIKAGSTLLLGSTVTELTGEDNQVRGALLSDGIHVPADLVVVGVGAVASTKLASAGGLTTDKGVLVDEFLITSDEHISAIGDCASQIDESGVSRRLECVQNAVDQARHVAGRLVSGRAAPYTATPFFWTNQLDLRIQIVGRGLPDDELLVLGDQTWNAFSVCRFSQGRLVAVESVNRPRDHVAARKLLGGGHQHLDLQTASRRDFDLKAHVLSQSH